MQVTVVFNFPAITDPNSPEADEIVENLTQQSAQWQEEWNALPPYKNIGPADVWVDAANA